MLLSRVAESLYWAGRYLERVECTARIVGEHTNLIVDLPYSATVTWEPLLAIVGTREDFDAAHVVANEASVVGWLIASKDNPSSLVSSIGAARENLRTTREVLPRRAWQTVNDLFLYIAASYPDGLARSGRSRFMEKVIGETQRVVGVLSGTMSRDEAYEFLRLGRNLERADMTSRVLDVLAGSLMSARDSIEFSVADQHADVQWASVLRSLSALQMFHRSRREPVSGDAVVEFLLTDERFPRSVKHCVREVRRCVGALPRAELLEPACLAAEVTLAAELIAPDQPVGSTGLAPLELHRLADRVQLALADIHTAVADAYFLSGLGAN